MYKIGEFSTISKTSIKTLRYYERENLLVPAYVNPDNGYRYYETEQLIDLAKIVSYRQIGLSINDIKKISSEESMVKILRKRKCEIEENLIMYGSYLSKINYLLKSENMENKIITKDISQFIVYYKEGVIDGFDKVADFVLRSGSECLLSNPNLKCVTPDYCFVNYLDDEYQDKNIKIRYSQAVESYGNENDTIKFTTIPAIRAVCFYHEGSYANIGDSYSKLLIYIDENNYEICDSPRECYIDGCWNKVDENDYLTEIQIPVRKKNR